MSARLELTGKRFGRLLVISQHNDKGASFWACRCDCGNTKVVKGTSLLIGYTSSCGCLKNERVSLARKTHGMSNSLLYGVWLSMRNRCYDKKNIGYDYYGGRGIVVCDRWRNSFENFASDMGEKPSKSHSLDRKDVNGNYEPGNCKWSTPLEQSENKRNNKTLTINGETKRLKEWCDIYSLKYATVQSRIMLYGWSAEKAILTPARKRS